MSSKTAGIDEVAWRAAEPQITALLDADRFRDAIVLAFGLAADDAFVYNAHPAAVTLAQVQAAVDAGPANNLHRWYVTTTTTTTTTAAPDTGTDGGSATTGTGTGTMTSLGNPPASEIALYTSIFEPRAKAGATAGAAAGLRGLAGNSKAGGLGASVAGHLAARRTVDEAAFAGLRKGPRLAHFNPALRFWAWACRALQWGGPCPESARVGAAHPVLPVFMHHFGCVAPTWEALEMIRRVVEAGGNGGSSTSSSSNGGSGFGAHHGRTVLDIGSGNGYWTAMLRAHGVPVVAVDNGQSDFRTLWVEDTVREDGAQFLRRRGGNGGGGRSGAGAGAGSGGGGGGGGAPDDVLLLVYPVLAADFTRRMLREYKGRDVVVAGTQNANGFTGFSDMTMDQFMAREHPGWRRAAQVALPSFPGKDEALYVFRRD